MKIIKKETFLKIFTIEENRLLLDTMILNFFGLEATNKIEETEIEKEDIVLTFILMINTEIILKINVKDTKNLFYASKIFYLNFSYQEVAKSHELLIPCYWEIYIPYCYQHQKNNRKLFLVAALLYCENKKEVEKILKKLNIESQNDIEEILEIVEKNIEFL